MKRIAVCPGSFDPVTLGHVDIIHRAAKLFGQCEVVVMNNAVKNYHFSLEKRFKLCQAAFEGEENIRVFRYEGMLYEYLQKREGAVLVKGIRNPQDLVYEREMAEFNKDKCGVETLYLDAAPAFRALSSTKIRALMAKNDDVSAFLPENAVKLLKDKL